MAATRCVRFGAKPTNGSYGVACGWLWPKRKMPWYMPSARAMRSRNCRLGSRKITFGSFLLTWPAQLYCKLFGYASYERHFTWMFPASGVVVELEVVK